jgi:hypothetical protein
VHHIEQQFEHHRAFRAPSIGVVLRDAPSTRKTSGISCARSYRTLRDGSFGARFPGTSCQATIGLSLRDENAFSAPRLLIKLALVGFLIRVPSKATRAGVAADERASNVELGSNCGTSRGPFGARALRPNPKGCHIS